MAGDEHTAASVCQREGRRRAKLQGGADAPRDGRRDARRSAARREWGRLSQGGAGDEGGRAAAVRRWERACGHGGAGAWEEGVLGG